MAGDQKAKSYRPGGFILDRRFLAAAGIGLAIWLGLFFVAESTDGIVAAVAAALLVGLGLCLGLFVFSALLVEAIGMTIQTGESRYLYAPVLVAAMVIGFGVGYLAEGVF